MIVNNDEAGSPVTQAAFHNLPRKCHHLVYGSRSQVFLTQENALTVEVDQQQPFFSHSAKPGNKVPFHLFRIVEHMSQAFRLHSKTAGDLARETNERHGIQADSRYFA